MAKNPPKKPTSKTPKTKAGRPDVQPIGPALAELLNPAINRGDAGMGSGTGLQPPPDNSWDRRAGDTIDAIDKEVRRIAEEGPTQKELDEAKSYLKGSQMLALDTSSKLAQALLQYQQDKLPIDYIEKRNAVVDAVTLDDAKAAAKRLWGQGLLTVVVGRAPQAAAQPAAAPATKSN